VQGDQLLAKFERGAGPTSGLADERVQPSQRPLVPAEQAWRQHRDGLVGRDGEGLQFDQGVIDAPDLEAEGEVVRGGTFR